MFSARLTKKKNGGRIWKLEAKELLLSEDPHDNRQGQTNTEMLAGSSLSLLPRSKLLPLTTSPIDQQSPRPSSRPWLKTSRVHRSPQTFSCTPFGYHSCSYMCLASWIHCKFWPFRSTCTRASWGLISDFSLILQSHTTDLYFPCFSHKSVRSDSYITNI